MIFMLQSLVFVAATGTVEDFPGVMQRSCLSQLLGVLALSRLDVCVGIYTSFLQLYSLQRVHINFV